MNKAEYIAKFGEEAWERQKDYCRKWRQEHQEYRKEYDKQWRKKNADKKREYDKEYYQSHIDERREYGRCYSEKYNKDHKEERKKYYEEHKEERKKYREGRREELIEYNRQYRNTKHGKAIKLKGSYIVQDTNNGFPIDQNIDEKWIMEHVFESACIYCGESDWRKLGVDRIDNTKGHTPDNCVCACERCNKRRQDKYSVEEFVEKMKKEKGGA